MLALLVGSVTSAAIKLRKLAERLVGLTMSSHATKRSALNDSLYLTEVIVFAGYQLEFEPALLVV